jgi:hypothetical protein
MSEPARTRRSRATAAAVAAAVVLVAAWLLTREGRREEGAGLPPRTTSAGAATDPAAPTESAPPALQGSPSSASPRVVLLALESETRKPVVGATWRVGRNDGSARFEGVTGVDGTSPLPSEALADWEQHGLRIWGADRRDESFREPLPAKDGVIEILLDRFHVDHEGVVLDEAGRPVEGAQVAIVYWSRVDSSLHRGEDDVFRTTTDAQGRFRRSAKVWHPETDIMDHHLLVVGALGFVPSSRRLDIRGEKEIVVRLARDREHGTLDIEATTAEGSPARGASVWVGAVPTVPDEPISPDGWVGRMLAEVWREEDDPREPGETWTTIDPTRREAWHHVLGEGGRRTVFPVPVGRVRVQALGGDRRGSADVWVQVLPPPAVTTLALRLEPLRTVRATVRVARDPTWSCAHGVHRHAVALEDWPEPAWQGELPAKPFVFDVPRSVALLRFVTQGHPDAVVALSPTAGDDLDLGTVEVASARVLSGALVWPDGARPEPSSGVRLEDADGVVAETTTYWTSRSGQPWFDFVATRPPGPAARILVRLRESDGEAGKVVRLDGPFDFEAGRLVLHLPPGTPGRRAEDGDPQ